jgi:hypothetical protein
MSALPPKADIAKHSWDVRFVPIPDVSNRSKIVRYSITSASASSVGGSRPSVFAVLRLIASTEIDRLWKVRLSADHGHGLGRGVRPRRYGEAKSGAARCIRRRVNPPAVSVNNRAADRQSHAHTLGLGRVEGIEQALDTFRV